tara:strand:- start:3903 stop:4190 length:288 start_codon:yes stop_codon:yes gene_type:complete
MFGSALSAATSAKNPSNGGTNGLINSALGQLAARVAEPNIPMSESYNSAASSPVFPPATQERAASVFGTNDQRQMSTTGFKQEIKERIIEDISSL